MILRQHKIVFGGKMGAGKSRAIKTLSNIPVLSTEALNTDVESHQKELTTVGIDYGEIVLDDKTQIGLYGTPGQERFDFMWPVVCQGAIGIAILIDHSSENPLDDLEFYYHALEKYSSNIVIGITHIDAKLERPTSLYRSWLDQKELNLPVFFVDARRTDDMLLLLETLMSAVEVFFNPNSKE